MNLVFYFIANITLVQVGNKELGWLALIPCHVDINELACLISTKKLNISNFETVGKFVDC